MVSPHVVKKLLVIVGPTASGKSKLALHLAKSKNAEIINADSRQFYKEMVIGTAKPTDEEQKKIPHHLLDVTSITKPWSVGDFVKHAQQKIQEIQNRGKVPILVGGTGLYTRSLLFGLAKIPIGDPELRLTFQKKLEEKGLPALYQELRQKDPIAAERLSPTDKQRILRALEVFAQTGQPIHEFWSKEKKACYDYVKVGLQFERKDLYERINERVLQMILQGLKQEAQDLHQRFPQNPVLNATIGYQEWLQIGFDCEEEVIAKIQKNSRQFAKRQLTWFRHENDITWFDSQEKNVYEKIGEFYEKS